MGIDYGTKRIGLALSDESGTLAFPKKIVSTGKQALADILDIITTEQVEQIVVGNSLDNGGTRNSIMEDVDVFVEQLHKLTGIPVGFMDERFSSTAVRAFNFEKPIANTRGNSRPTDHIDDRAAAVMLQRYLDRQ